MHKVFHLLLCFSLAGLFLLSACAGTRVEQPAASMATSSSAVEETAVLQTPTLKAASTNVVKSTPTPAAPTRTARPTRTPTVTETMSADSAVAKINLLLENLVADLEDTEIVHEIEIP